eukprot:jgi/Bigna1/144102/aug1.84_g18810
MSQNGMQVEAVEEEDIPELKGGGAEPNLEKGNDGTDAGQEESQKNTKSLRTLFPNKKRVPPLDLSRECFESKGKLSEMVRIPSTPGTIRSKEGTQLHAMVMDVEVAALKDWLEAHKEKIAGIINRKDGNGCTALLKACSKHKDVGWQMTDVLIQYGANLHIKDQLG